MHLGNVFGQAEVIVTSVTASLGSLPLLRKNENRIRVILFNHSPADMFLKFGTGATAADFSVKLSSGSYYETPMPIHTGSFTAAWGAATGSVMITEFGVR
jgi:hypothetical protein